MEVIRVEQRAYIKIAVLRGRNLPCDFHLIPKIKKPIRGRRFATREDIANAVRQQVTRFTVVRKMLMVFSASNCFSTTYPKYSYLRP
ncbi:hypothetical protein TNCV_4845871 [Trichonephila clavipes]|uniref:Uncharacterized protein n=1 Tax=Trichonephila clavipes TaxID=2585209 RepID=A0A8X6WJT2_TRICX|nr:hypothetical protein TNCV_4845871 [Trichonephila clavipes]